MFTEIEIKAPNGIAIIGILFIAQLLAVGSIFVLSYYIAPVAGIIGLLLSIIVGACWFGFFMVNP
ncbi:MAG: SPFH domain-containing protein, partial [Alteromonadaceae bacterium]|nr:SPFH domain-containing protein [Alteromonadaceae bacterium]